MTSTPESGGIATTFLPKSGGRAMEAAPLASDISMALEAATSASGMSTLLEATLSACGFSLAGEATSLASGLKQFQAISEFCGEPYARVFLSDQVLGPLVVLAL